MLNTVYQMNKHLLIRTTIVLLIVMAIACTHKKNTPVPASTTTGNNGGGNNPVDTGICFTRDILPIFTGNCTGAGCHNGVDKADGYVLTTYENIINSKEFVKGNASETKLYDAITETNISERMPLSPNPPLSSAQIALIGRWINEGAKYSDNCGTLCDSNNFTYIAVIKPMMDNNCKGCHNSANASKGIALDSYAGIKDATLNGKMLQAIRHEAGVAAMPVGGAKLSNCQIAQVQKWAAIGAPEN